jgi:hypothetical protein
VETGIRRAPSARLVYVTPSHQYPLGVTMSYPRRQALYSGLEALAPGSSRTITTANSVMSANL